MRRLSNSIVVGWIVFGVVALVAGSILMALGVCLLDLELLYRGLGLVGIAWVMGITANIAVPIISKLQSVQDEP